MTKKRPQWWSTFKTNDLFRPGGNVDLNACVGDRGPYSFDDYAWGYIDAGHAIVRAAEEKETPVDVVVYPATYCYRHGVELWLKHFAVQLPPLWGEKSQVRPTHKLQDNWDFVKQYLPREPSFDEDGKALPFLDQVIANLIEFDPNGEVFRFPEDRRGGLHLQDARIINLDILRKVMTVTGELFKHFGRVAEAMYEIHAEGNHMARAEESGK